MASETRSRRSAWFASLGAALRSGDARNGRIASGIWLLLFAAAAWVLVSNARKGADFYEYEAWGKAFYDSDIFLLGSRVASPLGLPLSVHAAGPGMLFGVGRLWFASLASSIRPDFLLMGLAALCSWWLLLRLIARVSSTGPAITALVGGLAFVGTHLGYYSGAYSSELPSFFALSVLYYFAFGTERVRLFEALVIGVASGLCVLIRTQLVMYLVLPWAALAYRVYARSGLSRRSWLLLLAAVLPCLVLMIQAGYVNRWMTGSVFRTPYQFGDAEWQSVDLRRPELGAVLLHARHGLLAYHPLYLVLCGCCVYLLVTTRSWIERGLSAGALVIVALHLYLQAAWFCWWLGTGSFGMRGMITLAVLLLPALGIVLERRRAASRPIWPLLLLCAACSAWSLLLCLQGETNFNSWAELWQAQVKAASRPLVFVPALAALVVAAAARVVTWRRSDAGLPALAAASVGLATLAVLDPWVQGLMRSRSSWREDLPYYLGAAAAVVSLAAFAALRLAAPARSRSPFTERLVGGFALAVVLTGSIQFQSLAARTEAYVRDPKPEQHGFVLTSTVLWDQIVPSYYEYLPIPGFEQPKQRFLAYLERHYEDWAFVREDRERERERKRQRQRQREERRKRSSKG